MEDYDICLFNHPERNSIKNESNYILSKINQNCTYLKTKLKLQSQLLKANQENPINRTAHNVCENTIIEIIIENELIQFP